MGRNQNRNQDQNKNQTSDQNQILKEEAKMTEELKTITSADAIAKLTLMLNPTSPMATIHNTIIQAAELAKSVASTEPSLTIAYGGHACGGWRKPLLQSIAGEFGLIPCLTMAEAAPGKGLNQQAAFYGNAEAGKIAAHLYTLIYQFTNVNGNKKLRDARADGHKAGKSGSAGDRLQENVYNLYASEVLASLGCSTQEVPKPTKTSFNEKYSATMAKGGMVFSGAYDPSKYDGKLALVTAK